MIALANGLCECGCEELVKPKRRFVNGHNRRGESQTVEARSKIGNAHRGERNHYYGRKGEDHPGYRPSGRHVDTKGYVYLLVHEGHPLFEMAKPKGQSYYIMEHRLVMAESLGRPLKTEEHVHHKLSCEGGSGDTTDNRIGNLMLFASRGAHAAHHRELERMSA